MDPLSLVADWPVDRVAVGVVRLGPAGGSDVLGMVGPAEESFPWASVTKPATALAILVAVEEGTLSLDDPAGPPGSTVRHLLAHASGLAPEAGPPLATPGALRIYSNEGYRVLADLVQRRSGIDFADYLRRGVFEPLGMTATAPDDDAPAGLAAAGLAGPLADLLRLGREWATPTLVSSATHLAAASVAFPGLGGVLPGFRWFDPCDWGLGVELRGRKQPHWTGTANSPDTYGHFGRSGSYLWIDPVAGILCAGLSDRPFGPWAVRSWPRLADAILAAWAGGPGPPPGSPA